ncbi:MAG: hypothetical protein CBC65_000490 [Rhodothermaceae bacterium TMED105]|nr:MAG: hypothetical protein CBC65_000490 [Rhodothermaceae bacterium TMED105]|tara:strand:- start:9035 stop:9610 length:576 start_codon:yes stop_codon:yes gene_type:complete
MECVNDVQKVCDHYKGDPKWVEHYRKIASFLRKGGRFRVKNDEAVSNLFIIRIRYLVNNKVDLEQYFKEGRFIPEIFQDRYPAGFSSVIHVAEEFLDVCSKKCGLWSRMTGSGPCTRLHGRCVTKESKQNFLQNMEGEFKLFLKCSMGPVRFNGFSFGVVNTFMHGDITPVEEIFTEMYETSQNKEITLSR